jgi:hypothetical protein
MCICVHVAFNFVDVYDCLRTSPLRRANEIIDKYAQILIDFQANKQSNKMPISGTCSKPTAIMWQVAATQRAQQSNYRAKFKCFMHSRQYPLFIKYVNRVEHHFGITMPNGYTVFPVGVAAASLTYQVCLVNKLYP